jgi:hypothetical protein
MENEENTQPKKTSGNSPDLEERISDLSYSLSEISRDIEGIRESIQKNKSDNVTLKVLVYTGLIVLLIGFIYTNGTLQRAQTETLESSILTLQNQVDRSLMAIQAALYGEIQRVESKLNETTRPDLMSNLDEVKQALRNLHSRDGNLPSLIEKFDEDSADLQKAFKEYQQGKSQPISGDN